MKKSILIIAASLFFIGCNPSKEARLQKLETEVLQSVERINQLEERIETLENSNEQFKAKIQALENNE